MTLKGFLALLCLLAAAAFLLIFGMLLWRELMLELKVRRSKKSQLLSDGGVRPEWSIKDPPAWERQLCTVRAKGLAVKLRALGE